MTFFVAASDSSAADKATANAICTGSNDRTILQQAWGRQNEKVYMLDGTYHVDCGANGIDGNPYLYPAAGVIITGGPGVILQATNGICRITVQHENVKISGLTCKGYVAIQWYCTANHLTIEDTSITHSLDGKTYLPFGKRGGATAAFMGWGSVGQTMTDITIRNCTATMTYHHGFSLNLGNGPEGGGFKDILYEGCKAISCGSGQEGDGKRDWSCGFDIPDAGDITNLLVKNCRADDSWQDGFHLDGSWDGHRQRATGVLFEGCTADGSGQRLDKNSEEIYASAFYVQNATLRNCTSRNSRHAGYLCKNEDANSLGLDHCTSDGDAYGYVLEYGCSRVQMADCIAANNTRRALQATAVGARITLIVKGFKGAGKPVLLGITERLEFVDAPVHAAGLARYREISRPFSGDLSISVDKPATMVDLIEVHSASVSSVHLNGITVVVVPATSPPVVPATDPIQPPITPPVVPIAGERITATRIMIWYSDGSCQEEAIGGKV